MSNYIYSFLLLLVISTTSSAQMDKIDAQLWEKALDGATVDCIVLVEKGNYTIEAKRGAKGERATSIFQQLQRRATFTQASLINFLRSRSISHQSLYIVNAINLKADASLLELLAIRNDVERIIPNPSLTLEVPINVPNDQQAVESRSDIEWGVLNIKADKVWEMGYRGEGVVVGGQDTGYEWEHPAIKNRYRGNQTDSVNHNYNWHDAIHELNPLNDTTLQNPCGLNLTIPCDDHNHGTHTIGTVVGTSEEAQIGVAPDAQWIGCRNMERGYGSPFSYLECFQWFLAPTNLLGENPRPDLAPHIIVNSWSCPEMEGCTPANFALLQEAVDNLKASGVMVVVSAGNSGRNGCSSVNTPAAIFENSFSVGATRFNDSIASFSSRGPVLVDGSKRLKPNVTAPGVSVLSAIRGGNYARFSGTSMAGPHVAGAAALIISANPALAGQVETIENILEQTAMPMIAETNCGDLETNAVPNATYGFGRIDVLAAVEAALEISSVEATTYPTLKVFPNPTSDQVNLVAEKPLSGDYFLYNYNGQLMHQLHLRSQTSFSVDLSGLPKGIYFYRFVVDGQEGVLKGKVVRM